MIMYDENGDENDGDNYDDDDDDDTDQPKIPANDHLETGRRGEAETLSKRKSKISGRNICVLVLMMMIKDTNFIMSLKMSLNLFPL